MESVVVAFALGGVVGAVIAIHLLYRKKEASVYSMQGDDMPDGRTLVRREIDAK
jgi:hypothetical protein